MVRCSILGCKSDSGVKDPDFSFHLFPENTDLRLLWVEATGRKDWSPTKCSRICSKHFHQNELIKKKRRTFVYPHAVPNGGLQPHQRKLYNRTKQKSADLLKKQRALLEEDPEPVSNVCRACLATGIRMCDVAESGLQDTFEHVTGTELHTSDARPTQVCFWCSSQLQRFRAFCQMSGEAEAYMTTLIMQGLQIMEKEVSERHSLMKPTLDVKNNPLIAIHTQEDPDECATVEVKIEVENEVEDNNISDSDTESETEIGTEVKTGMYMTESENETKERQTDWQTEGEIKIEMDEMDIKEFDPFEAIEHATAREDTYYCLQCAEAFTSQCELLKHVQSHTEKKLKQDITARQNVKTKRTKRKVKPKVESQCKLFTKRTKTKLVTHVTTEHSYSILSQTRKSKRRKLNILKKKIH